MSLVPMPGVVGERFTCCEGGRERLLERVEVMMPVRVAIKRVRIPFAESLRFPVLCTSGQG